MRCSTHPLIVMIALTCLIAMGSPAARAAPIFSDGFVIGPSAYTEGAIIRDQNPAITGFTDAWIHADTATTVNAFTQASYALSVGNLEVSGGALGFERKSGTASDGTARTAARNIASGNNFQLGSTYYFSMLVNQNNFAVTGAPTRMLFSNGNGTFAYGFDENGKLGIWQGGGTPAVIASSFVGKNGTAGGDAFATNTTYFLSGRLIISNTDDNQDIIELFAPISAGSIPAAPPSVFTSATGLDVFNAARTFSQISVQGYRPGTGTLGVVYDELRLGTAWADVAPIPEPASLALMAAGALLMLPRRRVV